MKLSAFNKLDFKGRMEAARNGVCIGGRDSDGYKILLFQLHSLYIEVYYHATYHIISKFHGFEQTENLEPYLQKIDIDSLIKE